MKLTIDTFDNTVIVEQERNVRKLDLYSPEAFELVSQQWIKIGWAQKYSYAFTWLGRPVIQLPEDLIRVQEVIYKVKPDVIIETGVAHGGSLIFYASLCTAMNAGRVIGVDIRIHHQNRKAIESHELSHLISLYEGSSTDSATVERVRADVKDASPTLVVLDSCHTREHVLAELEAYAPLVSQGSYIIAADGIMQDLGDVPGGQSHWISDNPVSAVNEFCRRHPEFRVDEPTRQFDESLVKNTVTYWPSAYVRRLR